MLIDDLQAVEAWAGALLAKLTPTARRAVARDVAQELRRSQRARITMQRNPDGSAYQPRKSPARDEKKLREKRGRIRRAAMFAKLRTAQHLRIDAEANGLAIGFAGRVARIARVHQLGQTARVALGGPEYKYPARVLLAFTKSEREMVRDRVLARVIPNFRGYK